MVSVEDQAVSFRAGRQQQADRWRAVQRRCCGQEGQPDARQLMFVRPGGAGHRLDVWPPWELPGVAGPQRAPRRPDAARSRRGSERPCGRCAKPRVVQMAWYPHLKVDIVRLGGRVEVAAELVHRGERHRRQQIPRPVAREPGRGGHDAPGRDCGHPDRPTLDGMRAAASAISAQAWAAPLNAPEPIAAGWAAEAASTPAVSIAPNAIAGSQRGQRQAMTASTGTAMATGPPATSTTTTTRAMLACCLVTAPAARILRSRPVPAGRAGALAGRPGGPSSALSGPA